MTRFLGFTSGATPVDLLVKPCSHSLDAFNSRPEFLTGP